MPSLVPLSVDRNSAESCLPERSGQNVDQASGVDHYGASAPDTSDRTDAASSIISRTQNCGWRPHVSPVPLPLVLSVILMTAGSIGFHGCGPHPHAQCGADTVMSPWWLHHGLPNSFTEMLPYYSFR